MDDLNLDMLAAVIILAAAAFSVLLSPCRDESAAAFFDSARLRMQGLFGGGAFMHGRGEQQARPLTVCVAGRSGGNSYYRFSVKRKAGGWRAYLEAHPPFIGAWPADLIEEPRTGRRYLKLSGMAAEDVGPAVRRWAEQTELERSL